MQYPRIGTLDGATERDDGAYLDFVEGVKKFASNSVTPTLRSRYAELASAFETANGRPPLSMDEIRETLDALPILQTHKRLFRSTQDMRAVALPETYGKRQDALIREMDEAADRGPGRLILDPSLHLPDYYTAVQFHNQPGGYAGHPLAGYIYHYGTKLLFTGNNDNDEHQTSMVNETPLPADGRVNRILDLACAAGQSTTAWKQRVPNADVWGVDLAAPMLRYAHKRAIEMNLDVTYAQMDAEHLKFEDGAFDIVYAFILFHEVPLEVGWKVLREAHRVLRPGGVFAVLDVGKAKHWNPLDAYLRDFIITDNSEPYERAWAQWDFPAALRTVGFDTADENAQHIGSLTGNSSTTSANHGRWVATKL